MLEAEWFNLRNETDFNKYYPIVKSWWEEKGWKPYDILALSTTGIMIYESATPVCAGWLFKTDSAVGLVGHIISSNNAKPKLKKKCIEFLFQNIEQEASKLQIGMLVFFITTNSLTKIAEEQGYINSYQKCSELVKII